VTLPQASELDAWLAGYAASSIDWDPHAPAAAIEATGRGRLHIATLQWLRTHNDRVAITCPNLPDVERRYSAATTPEAKREALRALLAARDAVLAAKPAHDAVQAQASMPLQFGTHPTGVADAKPTRCTATAVNGLYRCSLPAGHEGDHDGGKS
jgi:hypothetical protein